MEYITYQVLCCLCINKSIQVSGFAITEQKSHLETSVFFTTSVVRCSI